MVENDRAAFSALEAARERIGARAVEVVQADALRYLGQSSERFDVVFLDPPFRQNALGPALEALRARLAPGAPISGGIGLGSLGSPMPPGIGFFMSIGPGLAPEVLYEGRDLDLTTDYRTVCSEVLARHMAQRELGKIFPGFRSPTFTGVIA